MTSSTRFRKLLEPAYIGKVRTRARLIRGGAHVGWYDYEDGHFSDKYLPFYEALARGGVGLLTVSSAAVDYPLGYIPNSGYRIDEDKYIESFKKVTQLIHKYDCPAFIQLFHIGPMGPVKIIGGQPKAASSLPKNEIPRPQFDIARALTIAEVEEMVEKFISAALRAQKAGFDGIELNAGCNHFLNSFLSRAWNRRHDAYGVDTLESRAKIVTDIIKGIKKSAGRDFAIIALINGTEVGLDKGITPEEGQDLARLMQDAGADAIHARVEYYLRPKDPVLCDSTHFPDIAFYPELPKPLGEKIDGSRHGEGGWVPVAAAVKQVVSIPVIAVGRLRPELSEKMLRRGMVDFVNFNRLLIADPELPNKLKEGRLEDIAPCTACLTCFDVTEHWQEHQGPKCQINAALGKGEEYEIKPPVRKKTVMVAGGGPAGMEAARVAACRGHQVVLYEKTNRLGGAMNLAGMVKGFEREDLESLVSYLKTQITKAGVEIKLGKEVTRPVIEEIKPDVLIIATGGLHNIPKVPGIDKRNVVTSENLHRRLKTYLKFFSPRMLRSLTNIWMPVGKRVVIMGGYMQGCQVAEFLVKRGRKVTILETGREIGEGLLGVLVKPQLLNWLAEKGVTMMTEVKYEEITDKGLTITTKDGKRQTLEADTIVTALPLLPNNELLKSLDGLVREVYPIGDCEEPHLIIDAIADGSRVGRAI